MPRRPSAVTAVLVVAASTFALTGCVVLPPAVVDPPDPQPSSQTTPSAPDVAPVPDPDERNRPIVPGGEEGDPGNPFPPGAELSGGGWDVVLFATDVDADQEVVDSGGQAAPDDYVWIAAPIDVSTSDGGHTTDEVFASFSTAQGQVWTGREDMQTDDANPDVEMEPGQTYSFRDYILVPEAELATGVMAITTGDVTSFVALS